MITFVAILHVIICLLLIVAVLLQGGENVDITAAFGGTSQAAFGPRGAVTLLAKITWGLGILFVVTSVTLAIHASRSGGGSSILEHVPAKSAPALPGPAKK
jgi:preprotein translocase subunit SecG